VVEEATKAKTAEQSSTAEGGHTGIENSTQMKDASGKR